LQGILPKVKAMKRYLNLTIILISIATMISGIMQIVAPAYVLAFIGADQAAITTQLFATIGMFMLFFGAMMLQVIYSSGENKAAVLWSAIQKFGASIAVVLGVIKGLFLTIALAIALFDICSGFILVYYLYSLRKT
jgi:O-antigen/teichoic acid export membrane protein